MPDGDRTEAAAPDDSADDTVGRSSATDGETARPDRDDPADGRRSGHREAEPDEPAGTPSEPDADPGADLSAAPAPGDGPVQLDPRVRAVWLVQAAISGTVFGTIVGVTGLFAVGDSRPGVVAAVLVFALGGVHAALRYRVWRYEVREESLYLERGVLTRVRTVVPYVRIQHVDASRGPFERAVGLATAVVYTAGSRGADVSIPGLTPEGAEALQGRLERLAIAAEGDDAV